MNSVHYTGEHLWIHYLGHATIFIAFFSALYSVIAQYCFHKAPHTSWAKALKTGFFVHFISVLSIISLILYMMHKHYYAYQYVWAHVSDELPTRYILSAFWEGQEGSFLLWMFWNCVLAFFFLRSRNNTFKWMCGSIILGVNLLLCTMLMGVYFGEFRLGSNPFALLRQTMDIPLFKNADYTSLIKGNGLNPLLQNYWMIIHPPTLFLGFASTVVPFALSCTALITGDHKSWLRMSLPWSLFSGFILGTGILMGGAWAYEALSFGGYWAWDPVENMSLVPWMVLIAGIHTNLVSKATGHSMKPTFWFYVSSFILVCYSSFLTRSGILGDSSAHAFTEMGLEYQLIAFCILATVFPATLYYKKATVIHVPSKEEAFSSREFWMFIGSLILLFGALLISFTTSIPVYNKIIEFLGSSLHFDTSNMIRATPLDPVAHHNQFQIWIAVFTAVLSSLSLFLKYQSEQNSFQSKRFWIPIGLSGLLSILVGLLIRKLQFESLHWSHFIFLVSALFVLSCSIFYLTRIIKGNLRMTGPVLSHGGFGLLLLGILFTGVNKKIISTNSFAQEGLLENSDQEELSKHLTLIKGEPMFMNGYWVNYQQDTFVHKSRIYTLRIWKDDSTGVKKEEFELHPEIQYDNKLTKVAASNPSIKREIHRDIFSLVAQIPQTQMDVEIAQKAEDSLRFRMHFFKLNDSIETESYIYRIKSVSGNFNADQFETKYFDQKVQLQIEVLRKSDHKTFYGTPSILFRNNLVYRFPSNIDALGIRMQIPDTFYQAFIPAYSLLNLEHIQLKEGSSTLLKNGYVIKLVQIIREMPEEFGPLSANDIGVGARIQISSGDTSAELFAPFIIRDAQVISPVVSSFLPGISLRFTKINPESEEMHFEYGLHPPLEQQQMACEIAENGPRTDFIVIQVIEFPWISLVWTGSIIMLLGLALASFSKRKLAQHVS